MSVSCHVASPFSIVDMHACVQSLTAGHGNVAASCATLEACVIAAWASDVGSRTPATTLRKPHICSGNVRSRHDRHSLAFLRKSRGSILYGSNVRPVTGKRLPVGLPSGGYWSSRARVASRRASGSFLSFRADRSVRYHLLLDRRLGDADLERDLVLGAREECLDDEHRPRDLERVRLVGRRIGDGVYALSHEASRLVFDLLADVDRERDFDATT